MLAWLVLLFACLGRLALDPRPIVLTESTGASTTEAHEVMTVLRDDFGFRLGNNLALVLPPGPAAAPAAAQAALKAELLRDFPVITRIHDVAGKRDPTLRIFLFEFRRDVDFAAAERQVHEMRRVLARWKAQTGRKAYMTGNLAFYADIARESEQFISGAEVFALGVAFVVLLFMFGGLVASLLPIAMGAATLLFLDGTLRAASLDSSPMAGILASLLGMALAIDYALFMVSRFQEEIDGGAASAEALATTVRHAGKTILVSAVIVLASILVLMIPEVTGTRIMARNLAIVVGLSVLNAVVVLPALLALARPLLAWPAGLGRLIRGVDRYGPWRRFATHVTGRPGLYFALSLGLVVALAAPAATMRLWDPVQTLASRASESRQGYEVLQADGWGGQMVPINVVVRDPAGRRIDSDEGLGYIYDLAAALSRHPDVGGVQSLPAWSPRLSKTQFIRLHRTLQLFGGAGTRAAGPVSFINRETGGHIHLLAVFPRDIMEVDQSHRIVDFIRAYARAHPRYQTLAGGVVERARDFTDELYRRTPVMVAIVIGAIFAILFGYMRAIVLPIKAGVMNFVPILGAFGLLTLIYQHGWGQGLLQTPLNGGVTNIIPITLFCIVFGLSMDYEVLILSRISEAYGRTGEVREAVVEGMARSGSVITGATLIFLAVFTPAVFSTAPAIKELGIGIVSALAIDATLVRLLLVPSFMMLMGRWNWWSPWRAARAAAREETPPGVSGRPGSPGSG